MNATSAARAYTRVGIETGIAGADPHRLILMLFDGALLALRQAEARLRERNFAAKGECISKAIQIIEEGLRLSLDLRVGGTIAAQLDDLYEYMARRLAAANAANDPGGFAEVSRLLSGLREAWAGIAEPGAAAKALPAPAASALRTV